MPAQTDNFQFSPADRMSRILIVEDERPIAVQLQRILIGFGYDVVEMVSSGKEALQAIENNLQDLVLMDIDLAGVPDGIETAAQIRDRFDIPVVYLTDYAQAMVIQRAKTSGPFGYVGKPVRERELRATIEMALDRHELENRLKESEAKLRYIFENAFDGISIYQEFPDLGTHQLLDCNERYAEMAGRSKEELLALGNTTPIQKKLSPGKSQEERWRIRREKQAYKGVFSWIRPDHKENIIEYAASPFQVGQRALSVGIDRDMTEWVRAEEQIKAALREKEVLIQEIHHRVKNNFMVVSSMLDLQADYVRDARALEVLRESKRRIQSMTLIHEQLYRAPDLAQIDFADYVQSLAADLFATYRVDLACPVNLRLDVHDTMLEIKQAIPCGLLINELLSNALKYAFPADADRPPDQRCEISVALYPTNGGGDAQGQCVLAVGDNGIGLPSNFEFPGGDTLGMVLIDLFTRQIGGKIEWQSDAGAGTTCRITFQISTAIVGQGGSL
ncbi:MAG: response regulator [Anaerolineae bacterium]|nr:response regulator [Anaerolineae bacterium]